MDWNGMPRIIEKVFIMGTSISKCPKITLSWKLGLYTEITTKKKKNLQFDNPQNLFIAMIVTFQLLDYPFYRLFWRIKISSFSVISVRDGTSEMCELELY